jgi:hypothetical protein
MAGAALVAPVATDADADTAELAALDGGAEEAGTGSGTLFLGEQPARAPTNASASARAPAADSPEAPREAGW